MTVMRAPNKCKAVISASPELLYREIQLQIRCVAWAVISPIRPMRKILAPPGCWEFDSYLLRQVHLESSVSTVLYIPTWLCDAQTLRFAPSIISYIR